ncbi:flagellar basal body-associated FliL family protein [Lacticigenium naphthae]|uniref:flagellar basal body-associated FliL family protein n=1 Tax=Lacticigenium naphthae TaxID=515351 RepID=UPI0004175A3A|nr:flagellar basal body-associated FliL family protein [Lacticigenium naphthae]
MASKENNEKKSKKGILLLLLVPLLLAGGVFIGMQYVQSAEGPEEVVETKVALDEFIVNLEQGESSRNDSYVKLEITLMSYDEEVTAIIENNLPKVRDAVIHVVHKKTPNSLFTEEEGNLVIKQELKERINADLQEVVIEEVYVTNVLMQ